MSLSNQLQRSFEKHANLPALSVEGQCFTYAEFGELSAEISAAILESGTEAPVAIFAERTPVRYRGVLGIVASARAYVPLNPSFPTERTRSMVERSACELIVVCPASLDRFLEVLSPKKGRLAVILVGGTQDDREKVIDAGFSAVRSIEERSVNRRAIEFREASEEELAYILFTSGSTGEPKGIGVTRHNLGAYLDHALLAYGVGAGNRASQMFEYTFDLSVHDFFVTWLSGGHLCVPSRLEMFSPATWIQKNAITHWFSVPSVIAIMRRLNSLKPDAFPSLMQSLFCGEALPVWAAAAWKVTAPATRVLNLYGPTEATIAVTEFEYEPSYDDAESSEMVSIGKPFPGHRVRLVEGVTDVGEDEAGEMLVSGPQVTPGYLGRPDLTGKAFITLPDDDCVIWYRTGDLVRRDESGGDLLFVGRVDSQIQLRGHRVELQEVETTVSEQLEPKLPVVVVPILGEDGLVASLAAIVETSDANLAEFLETEVVENCKARLPEYMVPSKVLVLSKFPLNANGKIDRGALKQLANQPA